MPVGWCGWKIPGKRVFFFLFLHLFQGRPFRTLGHLLQQFFKGGRKIRWCAVRGRWRSQGRQHGDHFLGGRGWTGGSQQVQDRRVFQERFFGRRLFSFGWDRWDLRLLVQSVAEFLLFPALAMSFLAGLFALESPVKRSGFGTTLRHLVSLGLKTRAAHVHLYRMPSPPSLVGGRHRPPMGNQPGYP